MNAKKILKIWSLLSKRVIRPSISVKNQNKNRLISSSLNFLLKNLQNSVQNAEKLRCRAAQSVFKGAQSKKRAINHPNLPVYFRSKSSPTSVSTRTTSIARNASFTLSTTTIAKNSGWRCAQTDDQNRLNRNCHR